MFLGTELFLASSSSLSVFSTLNRSRLLRGEDGWGCLEGVGCNTREEVGPESRIWSSAVIKFFKRLHAAAPCQAVTK